MYSGFMKRILLMIAALLIAGAVVAFAERARGAAGPIYSVAQIDARLRSDPASLMGRVVAVRGVVGFCPVRAGCPTGVPPVLSDHLGPLSPAPPLQLDFGPADPLLARLRAAPVIGAFVPPPRPLADGYQGVVHVRIEPTPLIDCYTRLCYKGVLLDFARP